MIAAVTPTAQISCPGTSVEPLEKLFQRISSLEKKPDMKGNPEMAKQAAR